MHRTPDGVNWRAIERANGELQIARRNHLATRPQRTSPWVERGSDNQAGRMYSTALATDGENLYVGAALGGLWKGKLDGTDWEPKGDNLYGGVHWLVALPGDSPGSPDKLIAATQNGTIHLTRDEGLTWEVPPGLPIADMVRRLIVTSDGTHTVFLIARAAGTQRLYRSFDRGESFQLLVTLGTSKGDVWVPRNGGSDVYLVNGTLFRKSVDLGTTWITVGTSPSADARIAGSEAGAPRFWLVTGADDLYRSDNAGASWTYLSKLTDFWGALSASIVDVDTFAYGGVEVHRTFDGASTFDIVNSWAAYYGDPLHRLHADIMAMNVFPFGPGGETWYLGTDGGVYHSETTLQSVLNLSMTGLRVSQYYSTLTSSANANHVAGGAQDQGYQWASTAPTSGTVLDFEQEISGDYGHLTSGDGTHAYVFSTYPGFTLVHQGENNPLLHTVNFPTGESHAWMPPVVADPLDNRDFFFCATRLYRFDKLAVASQWTPSIWSAQDFASGTSSYCSAFAFSPFDTNRAYAATDRGLLYHSNDRGVTWTPSSGLGPDAHYFYGTALLPSTSEVDTVYVGGSGYGSAAVYRSTDGGGSYHAWDTGLPRTLVYCLGEQPDGTGTIYAGTETAAYRREAGAAAWEDITGNDAPVTVYWSVEPLPHENTMRFGTYGRGIWDYRLEPPASCQWYCGSGVNLDTFTVSAPYTIGGTFQGTVGFSAPNIGAVIAGYLGRLTFPIWGQEGLVDMARKEVMGLPSSVVGNPAIITWSVPNVATYVGLHVWTQAAGFGGGVISLTCAYDCTVGY
jgi:photosystem II stability/assembly factor-like uncharacterized protein